MNKQYKHNLPVIVFALLLVSTFTACTKPELGDDFEKGDPPEVPGGFVNSSEVATANLVGYWDFNGNLNDAVSGTAADGTNISFERRELRTLTYSLNHSEQNLQSIFSSEYELKYALTLLESNWRDELYRSRIVTPHLPAVLAGWRWRR